jgi:hypothetical protein
MDLRCLFSKASVFFVMHYHPAYFRSNAIIFNNKKIRVLFVWDFQGVFLVNI